jgi:hypothetical protein
MDGANHHVQRDVDATDFYKVLGAPANVKFLES